MEVWIIAFVLSAVGGAFVAWRADQLKDERDVYLTALRSVAPHHSVLPENQPDK